MFILRKDELLCFILNESKFAKEYTERFFHRYEFQNEVVLKFTYKGGVIKGAQNYFFKKVYIENKDFAPLLNKGTTHQSLNGEQGDISKAVGWNPQGNTSSLRALQGHLHKLVFKSFAVRAYVKLKWQDREKKPIFPRI